MAERPRLGPGARALYVVGHLAIAAFGRLVPSTMRPRWAEEWRSELWHELVREPSGSLLLHRLKVFCRTLSSARDALAARRALDRRNRPPRRRGGSNPRDAIMSDLYIAFRRLRSQPGFTSVATLTLALGIGATTAIFSVVNGVLLRPLPFPDQDRLVSLGHVASIDGAPRQVFLSSGSYLVYRDQGHTLSALAVYFRGGMNLSGVEAPLRVEAARVSSGFFSILGVEPALGPGLAAAEGESPQPRVAVIGHGLWQRLFGGDPEVLGTTVSLDQQPTEIVGVMPPDFRFPDEHTELWYSWPLDAAQGRNVNFAYPGIGRLAEGVTVAEAEADLDALFERPFELFRDEGVSAAQLRDIGFRASVRPLQESVVGDIGQVLWVLMAAVGLILLVACANVANLFLVQAESRERTFAVQAALGASRGRLLRQSLAESSLVGLLGGAVGLALAVAATRLLVTRGPGLPRIGEIGVDIRVLGFAAATSALAALLFGSLPALRFRPSQTAEAIRRSGPSATGSRGRQRSRNALVAAQLALTVVLLVASGLMLRTFANLRAVDPGFRSDHLLVFDLRPSWATFPGRRAEVALHQRLLDRLAEVPGVLSVTAASSYFGLPIANPANPNPVWVEGQLPPDGSWPPSRALRIVMPGYFETLGIPLLAGRGIERRDIDGLTGAAVVSEGFARAHWGDEDAIGKRITPLPLAAGSSAATDWLTVVGVAAEVRQSNLHEPPAPSVYFPILIPQGSEGTSYTDTGPMTYALRTEGEPTSVLDEVRTAVREIAPELPLADVRTMEGVVSSSMARTSFTMVLLGIGAGIALLLAVVGIYGVMAYAVSRRTREIGVRRALGAEAGSIVRLIVGRASLVAAVGLGLGLAAAVGLGRMLESLLFGVEPVNVATYAAVAGLLAVAAALASWLPARRATRVDPIEALRPD